MTASEADTGREGAATVITPTTTTGPVGPRGDTAAPPDEAAAARGAPAELELREVERFLYREARLADEHRYEEWEALWTPDALYWVPANDDDADRMTQMSIVHDNRNRISTRVRQFRTGRRHSQNPRSRLRRTVTNIEILGRDEEGDTVVGANFLLVESRERGNHLWAGRYTYRLRVVGGEIALVSKKVELVDNARAIPTMSFLI